MRLGVVIPAYNAAATLPGVLARLPAALAQRSSSPPGSLGAAGLSLERLVIVDDGSADETARVGRELCQADPRLELIQLAQNRGYGGAVKHGLARLLESQAEVLACLHADGQYAPELLPELVEVLLRRGLDLLQGSRIASGTALSGGMPLYKLVAGRLLTALENQVLGLGLSDYHSGYLLYSRRALELLPVARLSDSFDFDLELIAAARALGLRVGEHPIPTHYGDEVSYLNPLTYGLRVLRTLLRYRAGHYQRQALAGGAGDRR